MEYNNRYRDYLAGKRPYQYYISNQYYYPEREESSRLGRFVVTGLAAAGGLLLAGQLFRSGALQPVLHSVIDALGRYEPGGIERTLTGLRRFASTPYNLVEMASMRPGQLLEKPRELTTTVQQAPKVMGSMLFHELRKPPERPSLAIARLLDEASKISLRLAESQRTEQMLQHVTDILVKEAENWFPYVEEVENKLLQTLGWRHARVSELVERIDVAAGRELRDVLNKKGGESNIFIRRLMNSIADPLVFIDENGNIADLRLFNQTVTNALLSLERDFGIPLVGFNPLQLIHLSELLNLEKRPFVHLFRPGEIIPTLTGNTAPIDYHALYINGNVWKLGGDKPELIATNTFLVPAQRGVYARLIRELSGAGATRFIEPEGTNLLSKVWHDMARFLGLFRQDEPLYKFVPTEPLTWAGALVKPLYKKLAPQIEEWTPLSFAFGVDTEYILVNRMKSYSEAGGLKEFLGQFFVSRSNIQEVNTGTLVLYNMIERLNTPLTNVGLGLPSSMKTSTGAYLWNIFSRRFLPVLGIYWGLKYINFAIGDLTGKEPEDVLADTYASITVGMANIRDALTITQWAKQMRHLFPGIDQFAELPIFGKLFAFDESVEELRDYWQYGADPVREGRYWPLGNTPFTGGRVKYFVPNIRRIAHADPEYTDTFYGSKSEYWDYAPIPTPHAPLAPLRRFLLDPYHFEKKHYYDRPYPVTGGIPEMREIPIIGPLLDVTIGRLIKPRKLMHTEEMEQIRQQLTTGGLTVVSRDMPLMVVIPAAAGAGGEGGGEEAAAGGAGSGGGSGGGTSAPGAAPTGTKGQFYTYITSSGAARLVRAEQKLDLDKVRKILQDHSIRMIPQLREPVTGTGQTFPPEAESDIVSSIEDSLTQLENMAGIYGFAFQWLTGGEPSEGQRIATADAMLSYNRHFWDLEIGGLGGDVNEIARRFIQKRKYAKDYNPLRNQMPSWLPGEDYFVDYHRGDPYIKIPRGEIRLPGAAYEALHEVPEVAMLMDVPEIKALVDAGIISRYDLYGPLNRFRILADVAPWSEEFKHASAVVSTLPLTPEEEKEVKMIRERVRAVKEPLRIYPYRFIYSNIKKERVHVTRVIDNNTFLTKEYPEHPIRLAGVRLPTGKSKEAKEAEKIIRSFIRPGAELTIGVEPDPLMRVKRDTYRTIPAVVYVGNNFNVNKRLIELGIGKEDEDDYSAPAVRARFSPSEIAIGSLWEKFAHADTFFHCVAPWEYVITANGPKRADQVRPGDMVLTHRGNFRKVVAVRPQPPGKRVVQVKLKSSNIVITVTEDHPILACRHVRKKRITSRGTGKKLEPWGETPAIEFVHAGDLRPYDFVVYRPRKMSELPNPVIDVGEVVASYGRYWMDDNTITTTFMNGKPRTGGAVFPRYLEMNGDIARLLGYYVAEGCIARSHGTRVNYVIFTFAASETEYVEDVCKIVRSLGLNARVERKGTVTAVKIGSNILAQLILHYAGEKDNKRVPEELLTNRELRGQFIRGLLRGDGTKAGNSRYDFVGMNNLGVLLWLRDALFNLWRIPGAITLAIKRKKPCYGLYIGKYPQLANYVDSYGPCPEEAFDRCIEHRDRCAVGDYIFYRVQSVEEAEYNGSTIDIEVEGDDTFSLLNASVHNTKFLQVRSALEMYKRRDVYGKHWQEWEDPVKDWLIPTIRKTVIKNPIFAGLTGSAIGYLFGRTPYGRLVGSMVGGFIGTAGSLLIHLSEMITGKKWIPESRRKEREVEEYFDILKYLKYSMLYNYYADLAREKEGFDVEHYLKTQKYHGIDRKERIRELEAAKREIKRQGRRVDVDEWRNRLGLGSSSPADEGRELVRAVTETIKARGKTKAASDKEKDPVKALLRDINREISALQSYREIEEIPPLAAMALWYKQKAESTMYAYDPGDNIGMVISALPKKEREYIKYFLKAPSEERKEILKTVPWYVRRILQAQWGLPVDPKPDLFEYFRTHQLPGPEWPGWSPYISIDDVKVKYIKHEGLDPEEFNIWPEDEERAERVQVPVPKISIGQHLPEIRRRLEEILGSAGLKELRVDTYPTNTPGIDIDLSIYKDRKEDLKYLLNTYGPEFL